MTPKWGSGQYSAHQGCFSEGPGLMGTSGSSTKVLQVLHPEWDNPMHKHRLGDDWGPGGQQIDHGPAMYPTWQRRPTVGLGK